MIGNPRGARKIALKAFWDRGWIIWLLLGWLLAGLILPELIQNRALPGSRLARGLIPGLAVAAESTKPGMGTEAAQAIGERGSFLWIKTVQGEFQDVVDAVLSATSIKNFPVSGGRNYKESYTRRLQQLGGGELPFKEYRILEFCNVQLAMQAMAADLRIGIFMPCRLVVFQGRTGNTITLMTVNPDFMLRTLKTPELETFTREVEAVILEIFNAVEF